MSTHTKHNGLSKISTLLDRFTKPLFKKRGFYENKLLTDWSLIVGTALAAQTVPQKIVTRKVKEQSIGTLYVDANSSAAAMQLHFMEAVIIEKMAIYCGFKVVSSLKIRQCPAFVQPAKKTKEIVLSDDDKQLLDTLTESITDKDLQESLKALGTYIITNHQH